MTEFPKAKIVLIGAGKLGGALLGAWQRAGAKPSMITVIETDPALEKKLTGEGFVVAAAPEYAPWVPDCVVIAVKPQSMDALMPSLHKKFGEQPLYISIAAGKTLPYFARTLANAPVVRAMPNTPALIGKGMTVLIPNRQVGASHKEVAEQLMRAAGEVMWLEHESIMDVVTAVSGSGPAYLFLFMEALIEAGKAQGLSEEVARKLVLHTMEGSAALALGSKDSLAQLRANVTSPGGTTEAAIAVLMKRDWFHSLVNEAVTAAVKRSKELA